MNGEYLNLNILDRISNGLYLITFDLKGIIIEGFLFPIWCDDKRLW